MAANTAANVAALPQREVSAYVASTGETGQTLQRILPYIAETDASLLIVGESGTGKRMLAHRIHTLSPRHREHFQEVDCRNLTVDMLRSDVGSNCNSSNGGLSRSGTIFFKDIDQLEPGLQSALAHELAVESDEQDMHTKHSRLIAGSKRVFPEEAKPDHFHEDLYYRTSWLRLHLLPLRHRKWDIPILADHFLEKYSAEFRRPKIALSPQASNYFSNYSWPGNIRQLEDTIKAVVVLGDERVALKMLRSIEVSNNGGGDLSLKQATRAVSRRVEKELMLKALNRTGWNRKRAAEELQISYKALLYKLKESGLCPDLSKQSVEN